MKLSYSTVFAIYFKMLNFTKLFRNLTETDVTSCRRAAKSRTYFMLILVFCYTNKHQNLHTVIECHHVSFVDDIVSARLDVDGYC